MTKLALVFPGGFQINGPAGFRFENSSVGDIISWLLPYVFVLAGLFLLGFLIFGGVGLMLSAGNPEGVKSAQGKVTSAIFGFIIIFCAYWLIQILETILGIHIFRD